MAVRDRACYEQESVSRRLKMTEPEGEMIMQFNWTVHQVNTEHQKELLRQAEHERLLSIAQGERTSAGSKLLVGLGQQLVNIGHRLQEISGEPVQLQPKPNA